MKIIVIFSPNKKSRHCGSPVKTCAADKMLQGLQHACYFLSTQNGTVGGEVYSVFTTQASSSRLEQTPLSGSRIAP